MKLEGNCLLARVFLGESNRAEGMPLYEAIVRRARERGLAGATVLRGIEGFGAHSRIHAARVMGIDPGRVRYLAAADGWLGPIGEAAIEQVGERLADLVTPFRLVEAIPARQGIAGAGLDY